eukprot:2555339-Rhodomonas_salina.2
MGKRQDCIASGPILPHPTHVLATHRVLTTCMQLRVEEKTTFVEEVNYVALAVRCAELRSRLDDAGCAGGGGEHAERDDRPPGQLTYLPTRPLCQVQY